MCNERRQGEEEVMDDREERIHFYNIHSVLELLRGKITLSLITVYSPPAMVGVQMIVEEERGAHSFLPFFHLIKS